MRIGIDFDNTLVCYDLLFWRLAVERGLLPESTPVRKDAVRNALRQAGQEAVWTELQGEVYGAQIEAAEPFPGVRDALSDFRRRGWAVAVISHKTRTPFAGPAYDLHVAGMCWLRSKGLLDSDVTGLEEAHVFWETTALAKHQRIAQFRCDAFIDDLPEFLLAPDFPPEVKRVLFDPHRAFSVDERLQRIIAWSEAAAVLSGASL